MRVRRRVRSVSAWGYPVVVGDCGWGAALPAPPKGG